MTLRRYNIDTRSMNSVIVNKEKHILKIIHFSEKNKAYPREITFFKCRTGYSVDIPDKMCYFDVIKITPTFRNCQNFFDILHNNYYTIIFYQKNYRG